MADVDYSKIPTPDLEAMQAGNLGKVSTKTLQYLQSTGGGKPAVATPTANEGKWSKANKAGVAAVKAQPGFWSQVGDRLSNELMEVPRIAEGALTQGVQGVNKLANRTGAFAGALSAGRPVKEAWAAGREASEAGAFKPVLGQSRLMGYMGNDLGDATNKFEDVTGNTGLVRDAVDIGGDIAGIMAIKPSLNALRSGAKAATRGVAERGLPLSTKRAKLTAAQEYTATANPLSSRAAKVHAHNRAESESLQNTLGSTKKEGQRPQFPTASLEGNKGLADFTKNEANDNPSFAGRLVKQEDELIGLAAGQAKMVAPAKVPDIRNRIAAIAAEKRGTLNVATGKLAGETTRLEQAPGPQAVGDTLVDVVAAKRKPLNTQKKAAFNDVEKLGYEMEWPAAESAYKRIAADTTIDDVAKSTLTSKFKAILNNERTTSGYEAAYKSINRDLYSKNVDPTIAHYLGEMKSALIEDAEAMGKAAETGDVMLAPPAAPGGKLRAVRPSQIKAEIAEAEKQLAKEQAAPPPLKEQNAHLAKYLAGKGETIMQNTGITDAQYAKSLADRLTYLKGKGGGADYQPPTVATANPQLVTSLQEGIAQRQQQLADLKPAEDFSAAYKKANSLARLEKERYGTGAMEDIFKRGNQSDGTRLPTEKLPAKYTTPTGADDLIRSLSETTERDAKGRLLPDEVGRKAAADVMRDHYNRELSSLVDSKPHKIADWIANNKETLTKYDLRDEFGSTQKIRESVALAQADVDAFNKSVVGQIMDLPPSEIVPAILKIRNKVQAVRDLKAFGADDPAYVKGVKGLFRDYMYDELAKSGVDDSLGRPKLSYAKANELRLKLKDVLPEIFDKPELAKLHRFYRTLKKISQSRNARGYGSGSNTRENATGNIQARLGYQVARDGARLVEMGGAVNTSAGIVSTLIKAGTKFQLSRIKEFIMDAMLDGRKADALTAVLEGDHSAHTVNYLKAQFEGYMKQATKRGAAGQAANAAAPAAPPDDQQQAADKWESVGTPDPEPAPPAEDTPDWHHGSTYGEWKAGQLEGRENGGPVVPGQQYKVGEKQPETLVNADGTQQIIGQTGQQILTPTQPGTVLPTAKAASVDKTNWSKRADGSDKGNGWLGLMNRPDGKVSSEISIGVNLGGKEVEIPTMVPTLDKNEVNYLLQNPVGPEMFKTTMGRKIMQKAVDHARRRMSGGLSPFAN
jgi:hypothetical protein